MLNETPLSIDDLLLDPNNPRFVDDLNEHAHVPDEGLADAQEQTLRRFSRGAKPDKNQHADEQFDVTNIKDLYDSMLRIGFVGIDRIVVRPTGIDNKYLVLEGNRRVATVKTILKAFHDRTIVDPTERHNVTLHLSSFMTLPAMVLETKGLTKEELAEKVSILLGIRHHGSLLEWEPLPRAYNIFTEYNYESSTPQEFRFDNRRAKEVASRLCIDRGDVTEALNTYVAYLQVRERFPEVKDDHFSLIAYAVRNKNLRGSYFVADPDTFQLDEKSLTKLNQVCQFATRDSLPTATTKKIVKDPKQFKSLGRLVDKMTRAIHPVIKAYAADLLHQVEDETDMDMTLDRAVDAMTAFENRAQWAEAVAKLLTKQQGTLPIENYRGDGNDRGNKEELKATVQKIRKTMGM